MSKILYIVVLVIFFGEFSFGHNPQVKHNQLAAEDNESWK